MKNLTVLAIGALAVSGSAQIGMNKLAVVVVGEGTAMASATVQRTAISEFNFDGTGQTGVEREVLSSTTSVSGSQIGLNGNATTEGGLQGLNGFMYMLGYDANPGTSTSAPGPNRVGIKYEFATGQKTYFNLGNSNLVQSPRGFVGDGAGNLYYSNESGFGLGRTTEADPTNQTSLRGARTANWRMVTMHNGQLFASTSSTSNATTTGIHRIDDFNGANPTPVNIATGVTSPQDFLFSGPGDARLFVASTSGLSIFTRNSDNLGGYTLRRTIALTGTQGSGLLYLSTIGLQDNGEYVLFGATNGVNTTGNDLVRLAYNDATDTLTTTVLASSGANRAFRGVEAVPEPATLSILGVGALGLLRRKNK